MAKRVKFSGKKKPKGGSTSFSFGANVGSGKAKGSRGRRGGKGGGS